MNVQTTVFDELRDRILSHLQVIKEPCPEDFDRMYGQYLRCPQAEGRKCALMAWLRTLDEEGQFLADWLNYYKLMGL